MRAWIGSVGVVANLWGWSPRGIAIWVRFGWGLTTWGIADPPLWLGGPQRVRRRGKVGPVCFDLPERWRWWDPQGVEWRIRGREVPR